MLQKKRTLSFWEPTSRTSLSQQVADQFKSPFRNQPTSEGSKILLRLNWQQFGVSARHREALKILQAGDW
jgi:DNA-binding FadR family transcriptional regulator